MKGNTTATAKDATNRMLLLEAKRKQPIRDIILQSYWIHRDWGGVCRDLSVCRSTLRAWRMRAGVNAAAVNAYVAGRMQERA